MKVLIATRPNHHAVSGIYDGTVEGELVAVNAASCGTPQCQCSTGFVGLGSSAATATAMVVDLPLLSEGDLRGAVADWLDRDGWLGLLGADDEVVTSDDDMIDDYVAAIHSICRWHEVGTVLGNVGGLVFVNERRAA